MAEPKFTPGPWHISKTPTNGWPVTRTGDYFISSAPMRAGHYGDELADLNLIAAAPTGYDLIFRAVSDRIDDQWLEEARAYLGAVNGNS